jgi:hypothetical protein
MPSNYTLIFRLAVISCLARSAFAEEPIRYLSFQIFTGALDSGAIQRAFPPPPADLRDAVVNLRNRIGVAGTNGRRIGVVLGPIAFDDSDEEVRRRVAEGFDIALETGVAVGFHLDDSMFWGRLKELNSAPNIEWLDWQGTPNTGRRLDWSSKPSKAMPQLCFNSDAVKMAVSKRASLLGNEIAKGVSKLHGTHKDDLFLGVIAGWETQLGRDFDTGKYLGYCALTNAGYSASHPPADMDVERNQIVIEFIGLWVKSLLAAGVPAGKVISHIAFRSSTAYQLAQRTNPGAVAVSYLGTVDFTPPATAFCDGCIPGISTYPQPGHLEQWRTELTKHGNPPWASSEGTAIDPGEAGRSGRGIDMEGYLGNLFNHGAVLVNVFGWSVGDSNNPFRKVAESPSALAAYRKFLHGEPLNEAPIAIPAIPPAGLIDKIHEVQAKVPGWIQKNGPADVKDNLERLDRAIREKRYDDAAEAANAILKTIGQ